MKKQRGITLVELLVVIVIMGAIFIPISSFLINSLETEKKVSLKNDVQREARLIMEIITEEMRDSDIDWVPYDEVDNTNQSKKLINSLNELLLYDNNGGIDNKGIIERNGTVLSRNIKEFIVIRDLDRDLITVKLIIKKLDFEFELYSEIIYTENNRL
ncbi:MAG: type II secretion system protein [Bacillus sp. (in: firmicutes)]